MRKDAASEWLLASAKTFLTIEELDDVGEVHVVVEDDLAVVLD